MCSGSIVTFLIFFLVKNCIGFNLLNNACKYYNDYPVRFMSSNCYYNPDILSDTPEIIDRHGYPLESYTLTTQDGYLLTIFRIPARSNKLNKQPVFLMQGILNNNGIWVHLGNRSLAFYLSDEGYDVWLGNIRGSSFAKSHREHKITSKEYWNFNLDSLAYFDVGVQLKFIKNKTGKSKSIIYVGHSMGTTLAFLYAAGYPAEAHSQLAGIIALAPALYFKGVALMEQIAEIADPLQRQLGRMNIDGLFYQDSTNTLMVQFCSTAPFICLRIVEMFAGNLTDQFLPDDLLVFFSHCPSGTSVQVLRHFMQLSENKSIKRYDYGRSENLKVYHLTEPRGYDFSNIRLPVYLFYGKNDALVSKKSVQELYRNLGSRKKALIHIPRNKKKIPFNHLDFLMAKDIKRNLYSEILKKMTEKLKTN